jgi:tetratricopeptide (TPR) repeat protein
LKDYSAKKNNEVAAVAMALEKIANLVESTSQRNLYLRSEENLLRELAKSAGKAEGYVPLASFLGRQGRVQEALNDCEKALKLSPENQSVIFVAVASLRAGLPKNTNDRSVMAVWDDDCKRVEGWVKAALPKSKNPADLLVFLADMSDMRGDYARVIDYNRQAHKASPANIIALNNLAWFLAVKEGNHTEALKLMKQTIDIAGPLPSLLDTQGTIYLAAGDYDKAVEVLEQAVKMNPAPASYFRLARAYHAKRQTNAAKNNFDLARSKGLTEQRLHPLEQPAYRILRQEYGDR